MTKDTIKSSRIFSEQSGGDEEQRHEDEEDEESSEEVEIPATFSQSDRLRSKISYTNHNIKIHFKMQTKKLMSERLQ